MTKSVIVVGTGNAALCAAIAALEKVDKSFPIQLWNMFFSQIKDTLKLLHTLCKNKKNSV